MSISLTNVVKHCGTAGLLLLHVLVMRLLLGWGGRSWPGSNDSHFFRVGWGGVNHVHSWPGSNESSLSLCVQIVIMAYV